MKQKLYRKWLLAGTLAALQGWSVLAQNGPKANSPAESTTPQIASSPTIKPATAKAGPSDPAEPGAKNTAQQPIGTEEILKMLQAGVSKDVMKAYIETAPATFPLSATDLVTLKEHGVPDELTVALIKRGAELTAQANQAGASNATPVKVSGTMSLNELLAAFRSGRLNSGYLDPEGYDYFRYYYLYPRTLASANQRLFSSPTFPEYPAWSPGYYSPWALHPRWFAP